MEYVDKDENTNHCDEIVEEQEENNDDIKLQQYQSLIRKKMTLGNKMAVIALISLDNRPKTKGTRSFRILYFRVLWDIDPYI